MVALAVAVLAHEDARDLEHVARDARAAAGGAEDDDGPAAALGAREAAASGASRTGLHERWLLQLGAAAVPEGGLEALGHDGRDVGRVVGQDGLQVGRCGEGEREAAA